MESARSYQTSLSEQSQFTRRHNRSPYMYGSEAPAYHPDAESNFDVIPGKGSQSEVVELPSSIMTIARVVVVVAIVIAAIAFVRVGLSAMSIDTAISTNELSSQIEEAQTTGNDLLVKQSQLSNSTNIKSQATSLGMSAPDETTVLTLSPDIVVTDDEGNLSLSGSISAIENAE